MYATIEDLRAEGITEEQASDERLIQLIDEATRLIDQVTGWFFEPRELTFQMNGRGTPTLYLVVFPIELEYVSVNGDNLGLDDLIIVGAPVGMDTVPRITKINGTVFPKGLANVEAKGVWGYTEEDGTLQGRTPLEIRRACMMLVIRNLPLMSDVDETNETQNAWRIIEEKTRDQSYKLSPLKMEGSITGDPAIDQILNRYVRPPQFGAV